MWTQYLFILFEAIIGKTVNMLLFDNQCTWHFSILLKRNKHHHHHLYTCKYDRNKQWTKILAVYEDEIRDER